MSTRTRTPAQGRQEWHFCHFCTLLLRTPENIKDSRRYNYGTKSTRAQELSSLYRESNSCSAREPRVAGSWTSGLPGLVFGPGLPKVVKIPLARAKTRKNKVVTGRVVARVLSAGELVSGILLTREEK